MKESEISKNVQQRLDEFQSMKDIVPSDTWKVTLLNRADSVHQYSPARYSSAGVTTLLVLLILINIGFILTTFSNKSVAEVNRQNDLLVISKELLITPDL